MCYIMLPLARAFFPGGEAQELSHCTLKTFPSLLPSIFPSQKPPVLASISPRQQGRLPFPWSGSHLYGKWKQRFSSREGVEYSPRTPQIISVLGATSTQLNYTAAMPCRTQSHCRASPRACMGTHSIQTWEAPSLSHPRCLPSLPQEHVSGSFQGGGVFCWATCQAADQSRVHRSGGHIS